MLVAGFVTNKIFLCTIHINIFLGTIGMRHILSLCYSLSLWMVKYILFLLTIVSFAFHSQNILFYYIMLITGACYIDENISSGILDLATNYKLYQAPYTIFLLSSTSIRLLLLLVLL